jgi:outer membrane receptor for ferrienterochelin and colicins
MKPLKQPTISVTLILVILVASCLAQEDGNLVGTVTDSKTDKSIAGANVFLQGTVLGGVTDSYGRFRIEGIPPGEYTVKISMMGYQMAIVKNVQIPSRATTTYNLRLAETPLLGNMVVVTASKSPEALAGTHQSVEVIGSDRLLGRETRKLEETLVTVSGIHFNEENISIRGSSGYSVFNVGSRVLLMVDGVSVLTSDLGGINWKTLPLLDIDRVEIVKGAGSALYGSSAMGGVVNLITKAPSQRLRIQFRALYGIYDDPHYAVWKWTDKRLHYERADLSLSKAVGPAGFRLSLSRYKSTGYMENNKTDLWNVAGKFDIKLWNQSRLDLYLSWMKNTEGGFIQWLNQNEPFKVPPYNKEDEIGYKAKDFYVTYNLPLSAKFGVKLRASYLETELSNQLTTYNPGAFKPGQGPGAEIQADWILSVLHHTTFGTELRWDISGSQYFGDHKGYTLSPYLQHVWKIRENLTATAGARWDRHVLIDETTESRISPKIGFNYQPWNGTVFRTTFGSGFRTATVFEKYIRADYSGFNVIPNPDLRSERSWFGDVGFRQDIGGSTQLELSAFQTDYWNMIEPTINFLGTIQFQNYFRARIRGVEGSIESWWWNRRLGIRASASYMDPKDINRDEVLPYRPKFFSDAIGFLNVGPASFQAEYRYASRVEKVWLNPLDPRVPVKLLFLRAEAKWKIMTIQLAVNNALNYHYAQIERRMGEVRNVMLSLLVDVR